MTEFSERRGFLRQIDLGTLELFVLICDQGSIAAAARTAHAAASAVSKRISGLEAAAGGTLLDRHARGVRPTPMGERLLEHAHAILLSVERLRGDLEECAGGVRGRVRVCASASAVEQFLAAGIAGFVAAHPDIRIELRQATSRAVADAVRNREADLGLCNPTDGSAGLDSRPCRQERLVLVTPPGHPLAARPRVAFAEALVFEQIGLRGSSSVRETLQRAARGVRRVLRQGIEVDSLSAMCRMIEAGLGVGVMPEGAFRALGAPSGLVSVALSDPWAERDLALFAVDFAALPAPARRFAEHMAAPREALPQPPRAVS